MGWRRGKLENRGKNKVLKVTSKLNLLRTKCSTGSACCTIKAGAELGRPAKASLVPPEYRVRQRDAGMEGFLNSKFSCKKKTTGWIQITPIKPFNNKSFSIALTLSKSYFYVSILSINTSILPPEPDKLETQNTHLSQVLFVVAAICTSPHSIARGIWFFISQIGTVAQKLQLQRKKEIFSLYLHYCSNVWGQLD